MLANGGAERDDNTVGLETPLDFTTNVLWTPGLIVTVHFFVRALPKLRRSYLFEQHDSRQR